MPKLFYLMLLSILICLSLNAGPADYYKIRVVDETTGRGVPMVELRTLSHVRYVSDSNGYIAFLEPGLMNTQVYFYIYGQGYDYPRDAFGYRGLVLTPVSGDSVVIPLQRRMAAERLYRVTGEGIYRDSYLLGMASPLEKPLLNGRVMGQDSNISLVFDGRIFWIWGDTFKPDYPLGNFSVSAATSLLPENGGLDPSLGVNFEYFVNDQGFSKKMIELTDKGPVWFDWVLIARDETGAEKLVAKYARVKSDFSNSERGIAIFNPETALFEKYREVAEWLPDYHSTMHPFLASVNGEKRYYFTSEFYFQRAASTLKALATPSDYESFTCLLPGAKFDEKQPLIERNAEGGPLWGWKLNTDPVDIKRQEALVKNGALRPEDRWLHLTDIASGDFVEVNRGSIFWNEFRKKWVMIAGRGVGEVWYAEGDTPLGPWVFAKKVADHDQLLYNPVHHPFFDQDNGRQIFFEGTFSNTFLPNQPAIPRYEYNQLMYRLSLDDAQLFLPVPLYRITYEKGKTFYRFYNDAPGKNTLAQKGQLDFLAYPPDRALPGMIPVYAVMHNGNETLRTTGSGTPAFYALPPQAEAHELATGTWQCEASDLVFFKKPFEINLSLESGVLTANITDTGLQLSDFRAEQDSVFFKIHFFDEIYRFWGEFQRGTVSGSWDSNVAGRKGIWNGRQDDYPRFPLHHPLLTALFEYTSADGKQIIFATADAPPAGNFVRAATPLCRVWKFPGSRPILDVGVRQVPKIPQVTED